MPLHAHVHVSVHLDDDDQSRGCAITRSVGGATRRTRHGVGAEDEGAPVWRQQGREEAARLPVHCAGTAEQ